VRQLRHLRPKAQRAIVPIVEGANASCFPLWHYPDKKGEEPLNVGKFT